MTLYPISLSDYRPSPRYPPVTTPWTKAQIGYAPTVAGPFSVIDTITLTPVEPDPTRPLIRNLTTLLSPAPQGWFQVTFLDDANGQEPTAPVPLFPGSGPAPRSGPCSPWCTGPEVSALPWVVQAIAKLPDPAPVDPDRVCAEAAMSASEVLYELSGRIFTGQCGPVTIRPLARATDQDTRLAWAGGMGYNTSWGYASWYDQVPGVCSHYGSLNPPEIDLGAYPVTEILQVKIDGVTIPSDEYELRDFKRLVRMRPSSSAVPTERWGWPTGQVQDLPDTQPGTFSVTYDYGQGAPLSGQLAARKLAEFLALPQLGDSTHYPARVTSISRQGVSAQIVDIIDVVKTGATGIWEVDVFLRSVNPGKNQRQATVWSPDLGRPRRQASPSV